MASHTTIFWFRRDLRLYDNTALLYALKNNSNVQPVFIFDKHIVNALNNDDKRISFIYQALFQINLSLNAIGSSLKIYYDTPEGAFEDMLNTYNVSAVYINKDYEPYATKRDRVIKAKLNARNIELHSFKDHVIFEENEILKEDKQPYTIYTPYSIKWLAALDDTHKKTVDPKKYYSAFATSKYEFPSIEDFGFKKVKTELPDFVFPQAIVSQYDRTRDFPFLNGTSKVGVHLRFGTVSIREILKQGQHNNVYVKELIWRDFFQMILWHSPQVVSESFKKKYDNIAWRNNHNEFEKWKQGLTGYPLVDAGMRQLNETGFMHNRVRMVVASFLCKHLLIDWRWGEAYFAEKLLDYDLAANNGNWQWAAGCGCDAAPYFRIFNPYAQAKKFDPEQKYVRKWLQELGTNEYPLPIVDHEVARGRCLQAYKSALSM